MLDRSQTDELEADELIPAFQDIFSRVSDRLNSGTILGDLPVWITRNTTLKGRAWSFKDHEFQIAIAKDQANKKFIKKCSQVGLTELQIRLALGYLRVSNGRALAYILPLTKMAQKISQSRVETIIEGSPALSASLTAGANSALYKRIGNSHFYMGGADKVTEAISTPLDRIIIDERDMCRDRILGIYNSRMRHTDEDMEMRDEFSTPTISNYGISAGFESSDQKWYLCKCEHCEHWDAIDFETQFVLPDFAGKLSDLEKEDFTFYRYDFDKTYIACKNCKKSIDASLRDPARRQWVAKHPSRSISGYSVMPTDVPRYNSAPRIIRQIADYPVRQDYWNFVLGKELDTDENKINDGIVKESFTGEFVQSGEGFCVGIDVGKYVHVMFGKKLDKARTVVAIFRLNFIEGDIFNELCELLDRYGFSTGVIDAGPDISLPKRLQERYGNNRIHPCYYVAGKKASSDWFEIDEETGEVKAARTKGFDIMVRTINKRGYILPRCDDATQKEVREHFGQIARKEEFNSDGEKVFRWVKLSDNDHYFHSLFYMHLAMEIEGADFSVGMAAAPIGVTGITVGSAATNTTHVGDLAAALSTFGFGGHK